MRRVAYAGLLAVVFPHAAQAQAVALDHYRMAETGEDGFALSRPDDRGHLRWGAQVHLDYAYNPLVYEETQGEIATERRSLVEHQLVGNLALHLGLFDRLVIFGGLPVSFVMQGQAPDAAWVLPGADGPSLGDAWVGARVRLFGERSDMFSLGLQATVAFPTAQAASGQQHYAGDDGVTVSPELLLQVHPIDRLRFTGNLGARLRATDRSRIETLAVSHELTWGLGATLELLEGGLLDALVEAYGTSTFESFGRRETSPVEIIAGMRLQPLDGFRIGLAGGTGLSRGYGSPDFRGVLTLSYAEPIEAAHQTVVVEEPVARDADGDGYLDDADGCPNEPEDIDQFEDENGCPDADNDQDGVLDSSDGAPLVPEDRDGFEDSDGVPEPDNDRDGLADDTDRCPLEAEDMDAVQDEDGCPESDADADTILDPDDHCPLTPGIPNPENPECQGCPALACVSASGEIRILERVEFAIDQDVILDRSMPVLNDVLAVLTSSTHIEHVRIEGHTDDRSDDEHNLDLSTRRGAAVRRWLVEHGIAAGRLAAWGCGESRPRVPNRTREQRQENRRVEFHIVTTSDTPTDMATCREAPQ